MRDWKFFSWFCIIASAAAAMVISYSGIAGLARQVGYGDYIAPLLPIAIDVAIVAATLVWLGQGAPARAFNYARVLALLAILTSVLANATYHGLAGSQRWWLASIVASLPPAFLAALVHLGALLVRHDEAPPADTEELVTPPAPEPEPASELVTSEDAAPALASPTPSVEEQVRQILDEAARTGTRPPGRPTIARQLGVSEHQVRQVLDAQRQADTN